MTGETLIQNFRDECTALYKILQHDEHAESIIDSYGPGIFYILIESHDAFPLTPNQLLFHNTQRWTFLQEGSDIGELASMALQANIELILVVDIVCDGVSKRATLYNDKCIMADVSLQITPVQNISHPSQQLITNVIDTIIKSQESSRKPYYYVTHENEKITIEGMEIQEIGNEEIVQKITSLLSTHEDANTVLGFQQTSNIFFMCLNVPVGTLNSETGDKSDTRPLQDHIQPQDRQTHEEENDDEQSQHHK